jgi:hypothetical protein
MTNRHPEIAETAVTESSRTGDISAETGTAHGSGTHHQTTITATFSVASTEFELGRAMAAAPVSGIEFEQLVSSGESVRFQFWAETADADALETALGEVSSIETVTRAENEDTGSLFQIEWTGTPEEIIGHLFACEARMLDVTDAPNRWYLDCQFESGDQISTFHEVCLDDGILVDLIELHCWTD